jgi:hypothetical protein
MRSIEQSFWLINDKNSKERDNPPAIQKRKYYAEKVVQNKRYAYKLLLLPPCAFITFNTDINNHLTFIICTKPISIL